jgi:hypothetical protein
VCFSFYQEYHDDFIIHEAALSMGIACMDEDIVQQDGDQALAQFFDPDSFGILKLFPESTMGEKELIFRILKLQLQHKWSNTSVTDLLR